MSNLLLSFGFIYSLALHDKKENDNPNKSRNKVTDTIVYAAKLVEFR